jgi:hypothetical protein
MKLKKTARGTNTIIHIGIKFSLSAGPTFDGYMANKEPAAIARWPVFRLHNSELVIRKISKNKSDHIS